MAQVEVTMPKMGESITEGTIITWHKQPGDTIDQDETLLEIGTDKVDTDVPSPAGGVLKEILVAEGDTVDVGTAIAIIETEVDAAGAAAPSTPAPEPEKQEAEPQSEQQTEPPSAEATFRWRCGSRSDHAQDG
jgi:pyruvate dehydrogenase E2 component (dihydrolipoamide acetyltransferase)